MNSTSSTLDPTSPATEDFSLRVIENGPSAATKGPSQCSAFIGRRALRPSHEIREPSTEAFRPVLSAPGGTGLITANASAKVRAPNVSIQVIGSPGWSPGWFWSAVKRLQQLGSLPREWAGPGSVPRQTGRTVIARLHPASGPRQVSDTVTPGFRRLDPSERWGRGVRLETLRDARHDRPSPVARRLPGSCRGGCPAPHRIALDSARRGAARLVA